MLQLLCSPRTSQQVAPSLAPHWVSQGVFASPTVSNRKETHSIGCTATSRRCSTGSFRHRRRSSAGGSPRPEVPYLFGFSSTLGCGAEEDWCSSWSHADQSEEEDNLILEDEWHKVVQADLSSEGPTPFACVAARMCFVCRESTGWSLQAMQKRNQKPRRFCTCFAKFQFSWCCELQSRAPLAVAADASVSLAGVHQCPPVLQCWTLCPAT